MKSAERAAINVRHGELPFSLRRSISDFLLIFTTGSLPVCVLPTSITIDAAERLFVALDNLESCNHSGQRNVGLAVCESCTYCLASI